MALLFTIDINTIRDDDPLFCCVLLEDIESFKIVFWFGLEKFIFQVTAESISRDVALDHVQNFGHIELIFLDDILFAVHIASVFRLVHR